MAAVLVSMFKIVGLFSLEKTTYTIMVKDTRSLHDMRLQVGNYWVFHLSVKP